MRKIPKAIVDKIERRNELNEEIAEWCKENIEIDGMDPDFADMVLCQDLAQNKMRSSAS